MGLFKSSRADQDDLQSGNSDQGGIGVPGTNYFAQLMVFLNGLILTVTAFAVLNVYVQRIVVDDHRRIIEDTRGAITENLTGLEATVLSLAMMVGLSGGDGNAAFSTDLTHSMPDILKFETLYWLKKNEAGVWEKTLLYERERENYEDSLFVKGAEQEHINFIVARRKQNQMTAQVITDLPGAYQRQEHNDPVIKSRPFAIVQNIAAGDAMVVGISRVTLALEAGWLKNREAIKRIIIKDTFSGYSIFYLQRGASSEEEEVDFMSTFSAGNYPSYAMDMGNTPWSIQVQIGNDRRIFLLLKSPLLMLGFGLALTFMGTLYVRNNQRQSVRMSTMNQALAHKNYELNTEMAERERLHQFIRKAEREYRAIIDSVTDIVFEVNGDGNILFLNRTWEKVTGFPVDQLMNRSLFEMVHPQDQKEQSDNFRQVVLGKKHGYKSHTRLKAMDGTYRAVELAVSMLRLDENRNIRVVGTITDVEERRRAERALTEAEKKYRTIVENAAGGIYQITPDGQFLSANPAMARILGYESVDQLLREIKNAQEDIYINHRERSRFSRMLEVQGNVSGFESQVRTRSGNQIWVNENARAVRNDEGVVLYFEGSMEDITKRKEVEIKLREAKIQSDLASRAKSEFLANMSHELRTPLNAIIGFSEIIRNEVFGEIQQRQYWDYANDIHNGGRQLLTIINEILDVSRIETGDRQLNESLVNMDKVIRSCVGFVSHRVSAGNLFLKNLTEGKIPNVIAEELAVKQIFINLLSNAIKFTPSGGHINISHEVDSDGHLRLSITDTGIGLDEAEIRKALSPFGQVETSFNRTASGAGLGLTLVDSLLKLHGGRLELFSQKGIGTTVTAVFPASRVVIESQETSASS